MLSPGSLLPGSTRWGLCKNENTTLGCYTRVMQWWIGPCGVVSLICQVHFALLLLSSFTKSPSPGFLSNKWRGRHGIVVGQRSLLSILRGQSYVPRLYCLSASSLFLACLIKQLPHITRSLLKPHPHSPLPLIVLLFIWHKANLKQTEIPAGEFPI